jgi:hypothetical protein
MTATCCSPTPAPPLRQRCSRLSQRLARERGDGGRSLGCCPGRSPRIQPGPGRRGGVTLGIAQGQLNEAYRLGGRKLDLATEPRTRFALRLPSHTPLAGRSNGSTLIRPFPCSCLRLLVTFGRTQKGLAPSSIHSCLTHPLAVTPLRSPGASFSSRSWNSDETEREVVERGVRREEAPERTPRVAGGIVDTATAEEA